MCPPNPIWNNRNVRSNTHSLHMPTLFSCVRLYSTQTITSEEGMKGHRRSSWMENSHGAPRFPIPESQETHTGNAFTQQDRNASSEKAESNQISAARNTPPPLHPWKQPVCVYFPHPIATCNKLSGQKQTNEKYPYEKNLLAEAWLLTLLTLMT